MGLCRKFAEFDVLAQPNLPDVPLHDQSQGESQATALQNENEPPVQTDLLDQGESSKRPETKDSKMTPDKPRPVSAPAGLSLPVADEDTAKKSKIVPKGGPDIFDPGFKGPSRRLDQPQARPLVMIDYKPAPNDEEDGLPHHQPFVNPPICTANLPVSREVPRLATPTSTQEASEASPSAQNTGEETSTRHSSGSRPRGFSEPQRRS